MKPSRPVGPAQAGRQEQASDRLLAYFGCWRTSAVDDHVDRSGSADLVSADLVSAR